MKHTHQHYHHRRQPSSSSGNGSSLSLSRSLFPEKVETTFRRGQKTNLACPPSLRDARYLYPVHVCLFVMVIHIAGEKLICKNSLIDFYSSCPAKSFIHRCLWATCSSVSLC